MSALFSHESHCNKLPKSLSGSHFCEGDSVATSVALSTKTSMTTSIAGTSLPFPEFRVHPPTNAATTLTTTTAPTLTSSTSVPALLSIQDKNEKRKSSHQPTPTPLSNFIDSVIPDPDRETWNKKVDFLLSVIGFAVDLANVSDKQKKSLFEVFHTRIKLIRSL